MIPKEINTDQKSLSRFIRLVIATRDTPTLIRKIAEHYPHMVYCSAFLAIKNSHVTAISELQQALQKEVRRQGVSFDSISKKLTVVAAALGLGRHIPESDGGKDFRFNSIQADYYDILGISSNADALEIKKAFRARALRTHPDIVTGEQTAGTPERELFLSIQSAYDVLSDPALKRQYDISRNHKQFGQWSEKAGASEDDPLIHKKKSLMRTYYGYPLLGLILLLVGVTILADMAIRESSLNDGLGKKIVGISLPAANDAKSESRVNDDGSSSPPPSQSKPSSQFQSVATLSSPDDSKMKTRKVEKSVQILNATSPAEHRNKNKPVATETQMTTDPTGSKDSTSTASEQFPVVPAPTAAAAISKKTVAVTKPTDISSLLTDFLNHYCQAYENRDLDRFLAFFSENAVENNSSLEQLIPTYRNNFQNTGAIEYVIKMTNYTLDLDLDSIRLNGRFSMQWQKKEHSPWHHSEGNIQMGLIAKEGSFLVQRLSYQFDKQ